MNVQRATNAVMPRVTSVVMANQSYVVMHTGHTVDGPTTQWVALGGGDDAAEAKQNALRFAEALHGAILAL